MKKIIVSAAIALGLAASAAADDAVSYTSTSSVYTSQGGNYSSFSFTLSDALFSGTAATSNAVTTASDGSSSYATDTVYLTSITLVGRNSGTTNSADYAVVTDSSGTVVASAEFTTSRYVVYDVFDSSYYYTRNNFILTFDGTDALTVGSTYTVSFYSYATEEGGSDTSTTIALMASTNGSSTSSASLATLSDSGYQPAGMVITVSSVSSAAAVPEPATATLSLLALAGLAARRRRK